MKLRANPTPNLSNPTYPPSPTHMSYYPPSHPQSGPLDMRLDTTTSYPTLSHPNPHPSSVTHPLTHSFIHPNLHPNPLSHSHPPLPTLSGPLDMRLDTTTPGVITALEYLQTVKRNALKKALEVTPFVLVLIYPVYTLFIYHRNDCF